MQKHEYQIKFKQLDDEVFTYGTVLTFTSNHCHLKNNLIPSGLTIKSWYMVTEFINSRSHPALPLLKPLRYYHIEFIYESIPADSIYFKITFYRRNDTEIEQLIVHQYSHFQYPETAYSYKIEMINAGMTELIFNKIKIYETSSASLKGLRIQQYETYSSYFRTVIVEEPVSVNNDLNITSFEHLPDPVVIYNWQLEDEEAIFNILKETFNQPIKIVGYGKSSNKMAKRLGELLKMPVFLYDEVSEYGECYISHNDFDYLDILYPSRHLKSLNLGKLMENDNE